jgi:murein DD-endopeptidase MepM/ murein hydrolase activator NlpD
MEDREDGHGARLIELELGRPGQTAARLTRAADESWRLTKGDEGLPPVRAQTGAPHEAPTVLQGRIEDVLYGEPANTADAAVQLKAARLFASALDMTRDVDLGDTVRLVFTRELAADGRVLGARELLYAELDTRNGPKRFYRHRASGGQGGFVDDQGLAVEHALLRTPVERPRITSDFGMRLHPLLGYTRMHQGVDFGAPVGSPVLAAADGVVESLNWSGGYGRCIKLRHSGSLETRYAHLSTWAPNVRPGGSVRQGEVIGYVGSTGLSTGPHLHYEVIEAGRPVDPTTVLAAGPATLPPAERSGFEAEKRRIAMLLAQPAPGAARGITLITDRLN